MDGLQDDKFNEIAGMFGIKPESKPKPQTSKGLDVPHIVNDELTKLGWSPNGRLAFVSNTGRENSWNADTIFKGHSDPKNQEYNRGVISWQKDRRTHLDNYLRSEGLLGKNDESELRAMVRFADKEMRYSGKWRKINERMKDANLSLDEAYPLLQKYILYRPEHEPDNKTWENKARKRGLNFGSAENIFDSVASYFPDNDNSASQSNTAIDFDEIAGYFNEEPEALTPATSQIGTEIQSKPLMPLPNSPEENTDLEAILNNTAQIGTSNFAENPNFAVSQNTANAPQSAVQIPSAVQNPAPASVQPPQAISAPTNADYRLYLKYAQKPDNPETKAEFEQLANSGKFDVDVNAQIEQSQETVPGTAVNQQTPSTPASGQILPQTPTVQAKNDEDILSGAAGNVAIDLRAKPKGENPGKFILRTALTQIAPQYGITQSEIENYLASGNAPVVDYYNNLNDEQYDRAIKSLESRKQNAQVNFAVRNQLVNNILNARTGDSSALNSDLINPALRNEAEYQSSISQQGLKQDQQNAEYFRQNTGFAKARKNLEAERMTDPFNQNTVTDEEITKRIARDAENSEQAKTDIDSWREKFGDTVANGFAYYLGSTARVYRGLAGIVRPLSALGINQPYETFGNVAAKSEAVDEEAAKGNGTLGQIYRTAVGLPTDLARLGLLSRLPGGVVVGFAADAGLQSAGRDESLGEVAKQTAKGAVLGATFGAANKVGEIVGSVAPAFKTIAKIGTVGGATYATERVFGTPHEEALQTAIVSSAFEAVQSYGSKILGKVGRAWNKGKASDITVDESGNVSLVKFDSEANPNKVDFEMVLDPTDGVYKAASEASASRGRQIGDGQKIDEFDAMNEGNTPNNARTTAGSFAESGAPRELAAENPRRIETAQPAAVEKLQTDARVQKTLENLKGKDSVTIDELQKSTRFNRQNVEDAVMTLYAAKQVEILPDNSVRFIGGENSLPVAKSLFERAAEIETPKEPIRLSESPLEGEITPKPEISQSNIPEKVQSNFKQPEIPANSIATIQNQTQSVYENLPQQKQQEAKADKPIAQVSFAERPSVAEKLNVFTERGRQAQIEPKVVDASELLTSLEENYPQKFQPRDRSRAASKAQISDIASRLNPEFLGDSPKASDGRPLAVPVQMPDGATKYAVISGNGRTEGIRAAYTSGSENSQKYAEFARSKGASNAKNPVYIGILDPNQIDDFSEFAKEANESATAQMSAAEQAQSDADRIDASVLNLFVPSEDGTIHGNANRDFVRAFLDRTTSTSERNRFVDSDGKLSQEGVSRIKNAIFAKAFAGSEMGAASVSRVAESTDSNIKNITNALLAKAGELSSFAEAGKDNRRYKQLDIAPDFARAMEKYSEIKDGGTSLDDYVSQGTLFGADTSPLQTRVMQVFDFYKRRTKAIRGIIDNYIKAAEALGDPNQQNLFGYGDPPTKEELFEGAVRFYEGEHQDEEDTKQVSLFNAGERREEQSGTGLAGNQGTQSVAERINATESAYDAATSPKNDTAEPSRAQLEAGNYRKGHINIGGLDISIEFPVGSKRKGVDKNGKFWSRVMGNHYGYIKRTTGGDGEQIDVFLKDKTPANYSGDVYVVDQIRPDTGKFDEHKALIGYSSEKEAREAYLSNYAKDWKGLGKISAMPFDEFKQWTREKQTKPIYSKPKGFVSTIIRFVQKARNVVGNLPSEYLELGPVTSSTAQRIRDLTGIDVSDFKHALDVLGIKHTFRKHGNPQTETPRGQIAVTDDDFALIPEIVGSPDNIEKGILTKRNRLQTIIYSKKLDGNVYYVETIREGKKRLVIHTLYKAKGKSAASPAANVQDVTSDLNPKGVHADTADVNNYTESQNDEQFSDDKGNSTQYANTENLPQYLLEQPKVNDLVNELRKLHSKPLSGLIADSQITKDPETGILHFNKDAAEVYRRAMKDNDDTFLGAYLPPDQVGKLYWKFSDLVPYETSKALSKALLAKLDYLHKQIAVKDESGKNIYQDAVAVVVGPGLEKGWSTAIQEELAHQADFRVRDFQSPELALFRDVDGYAQALENVAKVYTNVSAATLHNEVVAKLFRDDAGEELGITDEQVQKIKHRYYENLSKSGVSVDTIEEAFQNVSQKGQEFVNYAKRQSQTGAGENGQTGRGQNETGIRNFSEIPTERSKRASAFGGGQTSERNADKLGEFQFNGISQQVGSGNEQIAQRDFSDLLFAKPTADELKPENIIESADSSAHKLFSYIWDGKRDIPVAEAAMNVTRTGILASLQTFQNNIVSNTAMQVTEQGAKPFMVLADILNPKTRNRHVAGIQPIGVLKGLRAVAKNELKGDGFFGGMWKGVSDAESARVDMTEGAPNPNFVRSTGFPLIDGVIELTKRFVVAGDRPFKAFIRESEKRGIAKVTAMNEAKARGDKEWKARMQQLLDNPTELMQKQIEHYADVTTFQNSNAFLDAYAKAKRLLIDDKALAKVIPSSAQRRAARSASAATYFTLGQIIPFVNTPVNVGIRSLEYFFPTGAVKAAWQFYQIGKSSQRAKWFEDAEVKRRNYLKYLNSERASEDKKHAKELEKLEKEFNSQKEKSDELYKKKTEYINRSFDNTATKNARIVEEKAKFDEWIEKWNKKFASEKGKLQTKIDGVKAERQQADDDLADFWEGEDAGADATFCFAENRAFVEAAGRAMFGGTIGGLMIMGVLFGLIEVVGTTDFDDEREKFKQKREFGIPNDSIKLGGYRFKYSGNPFGYALKMGINLIEQYERKGTKTQKAEAMAERFYEDLITSNPLTDSMLGDKPKHKDWGGWAGEKLATPIPRILGEIGEVADDKPRKFFNEGFFAQFEIKIPGLREKLPVSDNYMGGEQQRGSFSRRLLRFADPVKAVAERAPQSALPESPLGTSKERQQIVVDSINERIRKGEDAGEVLRQMLQSGEIEQKDANKIFESVSRKLPPKAIEIREAKSPEQAITIFRSATTAEKENLIQHLIEKAGKSKNQAAVEKYRSAIEEYRTKRE